jgi:hypothetical protein
VSGKASAVELYYAQMSRSTWRFCWAHLLIAGVGIAVGFLLSNNASATKLRAFDGANVDHSGHSGTEVLQVLSQVRLRQVNKDVLRRSGGRISLK